MSGKADDTALQSASLTAATGQWQQRVATARAALASTQRRRRLTQRERNRLRRQIMAWRADLAEMEQRAEQAVATHDQEQAAGLAREIRKRDGQLEAESRRLRRIDRRASRLESVRRAWQWRLEQHLRASTLRALRSGRRGLTNRTTVVR